MPRGQSAVFTTDSFTAEGVVPLLDHDGVEAARLVAASRARLVTEEPSVTYALLARARGQREATVRQWVRRLRHAGRLITVESASTTLIPSFAFDDAYDPITEVGDIIARFSAAGMSAWAVWRWFCATNPWLEARPVDLVADGELTSVETAAGKLVGTGEPLPR